MEILSLFIMYHSIHIFLWLPALLTYDQKNLLTIVYLPHLKIGMACNVGCYETPQGSHWISLFQLKTEDVYER